MEYVDGRVLWNPALPNFARCERVAIFAAMNRLIADLHSVDYTALGLEDYGRWGGYLQRQVERWGRQYLDQCTQPSTEMRKLIAWLERHVPSLDETTIIHGDYKLENLILYKNNTAVMAVIDWELSTLGHPLADLAFHCMPWHLPPQGFDGLRGLNLAQLGIPTETDYVAEYCRSTGREYIADWNYYLAFNLFRRAAIIQGVITRADKGNASNIHAGKLAERIQPLAERAWELTRNNRDIIAKN